MMLFGKKVLIESAYREKIEEMVKAANIHAAMPSQKAIGALDAQKGHISMKTHLKKYQKNEYLQAIEYAKMFFAEHPDPAETIAERLPQRVRK